MSTESPMKFVQNGLVFYYDTGNPKSYKGEPTTNLITNPFAVGSNPSPCDWSSYEGTCTYTTEINVGGFSTWMRCVKNSASNGRIAVLGVSGLVSGGTYCISFYVYSTDTGLTSVYWGSDNGSVSPTTTVQTYTSSDIGTVKRIYTIFTSTAGSQVMVLRINGTDPLNTKFYLTGLQVEQKSHPTPVVSGTRSVTNGLVDLTRNYTMDLTNAAYDGNAKLYLSGGKAIKISSNSGLFSSTFTWSVWHYIIADGGTGYAGIFWAEGATGGGSGYQYLLSYRNLTSNAYAHYRVNNVTTGWTNTDTGTLIADMTNKWIHTTFVYNNGTTQIYINGVLMHTDTSRGSYNGGTDSPVYLGSRNDLWGSINGYIDQAAYFNRALSYNEVLQNYNRTKSKYRL